MRKYYVYLLEDINGQVFYVGKGSKTDKYNRTEYHLKYWEHNKNKKFVNKIRKIDGRFNVVIVFESESEEECLVREVELIQQYGKCSLCNLTDGGDGVSGYRHSEASRAKMSAKADPEKSKKNLTYAIKSNTGKRKADTFEIEKLYETKSIYEIKALTGLDFATIKRYLVEKGLYVKNKNRQQESEEVKAAKSLGQKLRQRREIEQYTLDGDLKQSWRCTEEAVKIYGICVRDALRGRQKTAYGYRWIYK